MVISVLQYRETQSERAVPHTYLLSVGDTMNCLLCNKPVYRKGKKACSPTHEKIISAKIGAGYFSEHRNKQKPLWRDINKIREIYDECKRITKESGILHHVDHIVPLRGQNVSGLHVHQNLRIITADENQRKKNKLLPEC